jgi:hypothetical protein
VSGSGPKFVQTLIGTMGRSYGGRRSREQIDARAARAPPHIHHMRPNSWVDLGPNWYKHLLGQWAEVMEVGHRECTLMRGLRVQTCAQHHLSSIGARRSGLIEPQIGTKSHWGNGHKLWGSTCAGVYLIRELCAHRRNVRTSN